MAVAVIEIYSSLECPYAYLATYRLRQVWPEFAGRVQLAWRALSLEYINQEIPSLSGHAVEIGILEMIEPELPMQPWTQPDWFWPVTFWPAFEALACAQAQGPEIGFEMSWALRRAFFAGGRCLAVRHELLAIAKSLAETGLLDFSRFKADWDNGRYKGTVIAESQRGWHDLKVEGSPTFVLPDGRQVSNPAVGEIDYDESKHILHNYQPYPGDPRVVYRELLESACVPRE